MHNKPRKYYLENTLPKYSRFLHALDHANPGKDVIKNAAFEVCNSLHNLTEYIQKENPDYVLDKWSAKNGGEFKSSIENARPQDIQDFENMNGDFFRYIRDMANAEKHSEIDRGKKIKNPEQVIEVFSAIRYEDKDGYYYSHANTLVVIDINGNEIWCEQIIYMGIILLGCLLGRAGLIPEMPEGIYNEKRSFYISREDAKSSTMLSGTQHEYLNAMGRFYIYDPDGPFELRGVKEGEEHAARINIKKFEIEKSYFPKSR